MKKRKTSRVPTEAPETGVCPKWRAVGTLFSQGFLSLVSEWEPDLYSVPTVVNALRDRLSHEPTSEPLLRALAKLYTHEAKYDLAISIYLE